MQEQTSSSSSSASINDMRNWGFVQNVSRRELSRQEDFHRNRKTQDKQYQVPRFQDPETEFPVIHLRSVPLRTSEVNASSCADALSPSPFELERVPPLVVVLIICHFFRSQIAHLGKNSVVGIFLLLEHPELISTNPEEWSCGRTN